MLYTRVMGDKKQSELRRAENEVVFRDYNARILHHAKRLLPREDSQTYPVRFVCECSDETCRDVIETNIVDFARIHKNPRHFVIRPHHRQADIERVVEMCGSYDVVEKFEQPPATDGVLNDTH
jgi:hypothetical protein